MKFMKHSFAMLLGGIYLPLKSVARSLLNAAILWGIGIGLAFIIPIVSGSLLNKLGFHPLSTIALTVFIVFPMVAAVIAAGGIIATGVLIFDSVIKFFKSMWTGLKAGYQEGMEGFYKANSETNTPLFTHRSLQLYINRQQAMDEFDYQGLQNFYADFQDVVVEREEQEAPNLQEDTQTFSNFLTPEEITEVKVTIDDLSKKMHLSVPDKLKKELLSTYTNQYTELYDKLQKVKTALASNPMGDIEDDLMQLEVKCPIYFCKEYQESGGQWKSVTGYGHVTDKDNLMTWLKRSNSHPKSRDNVLSPPPHNNLPTRYRWYQLTTEQWHVPELIDYSQNIRELVKEFNKDQTVTVSHLSMHRVPSNQTMHPDSTEQPSIQQQPGG